MKKPDEELRGIGTLQGSFFFFRFALTNEGGPHERFKITMNKNLGD